MCHAVRCVPIHLRNSFASATFGLVCAVAYYCLESMLVQRFDVEFGDGKKVKIPAKMAIVVQQKYNSMRKPADKEKFQAKIGKSYKDMLSALKEELQPKKESILERMNRKIKENKHG